MEVRLTPEQQQQLAELASQRGRDADALAQEAISRYLAEEARFVEAVKLGEAALDRGEYLTHEQVESGSTGSSVPDGNPVVTARRRRPGAYISAHRKRQPHRSPRNSESHL